MKKKIHNYNYNNPIDIAEAFEKAYNNKQINESKSKKYKRFILFDRKDYEKINKFSYSGLDIDYIYSDTCIFEIVNNQFIIKNSKDAKKEVIINFNEASSTIIYCKSGYLNDDVIYLLNKFLSLKFLVINNPANVQISANKLLTAKLFDEKNIQQPKYNIITREDCDIDTDEEQFNSILRIIYKEENEDNEYVCKLLNGHGGHGVFICKESNILSIIQCVFAVDSELEKIIIQEKINISDGDIRVYVLTLNDKQEIIDSIMREKSSDDFRTNISLGNSIIKYKLKEEYQTLVKRAAKASGLIFAGVDLCIDENKQAYILEINGAPGAPTAVNMNEDENREAHEKFYTNIINTLFELSND